MATTAKGEKPAGPKGSIPESERWHAKAHAWWIACEFDYHCQGRGGARYPSLADDHEMPKGVEV